MNTFMNALLPQIHVVRGARKISFWVPAEDFSAETGMTYLQEVEQLVCAVSGWNSYGGSVITNAKFFLN